jgi:2,5-diketo-D-gluconate reductase B
MIHWPSRDMDMAATLEALIELREGGLARAIGVCNFNLPMIRRAVEEIGAPIAAHQVEYHPFLSQAPMLDYLRSKATPLTTYAPLAQGRAANDPTRAAIGCKHGATRTGGNRLAAGPGGRHCDSQGRSPGKPEG